MRVDARTALLKPRFPISPSFLLLRLVQPCTNMSIRRIRSPANEEMRWVDWSAVEFRRYGPSVSSLMVGDIASKSRRSLQPGCDEQGPEAQRCPQALQIPGPAAAVSLYIRSSRTRPSSEFNLRALCSLLAHSSLCHLLSQCLRPDLISCPRSFAPSSSEEALNHAPLGNIGVSVERPPASLETRLASLTSPVRGKYTFRP